ncbi:MAG: hypothetical protein KKF46_01320 [Nanoarchaeota archaeon]|nr:hypothetical protein [Nanoarchaeota archaeon]MBU1320973.1 hypothetical protein [Nanoarchaeota archaeon]MBU1598358.1 hypothetical protein [Nanoarchaeota archaeon]MBU2441740.1 hypothetical protein [Nanoarchaeota archaeon]
MKRLIIKQIHNIRNLKSQGKSLREICTLTRIPLSTLQYQLSKGESRKREKNIRIPKDDFVIGELIGAFAGDGNYYLDKNGRSYKYHIRFFLSYRDDTQYKLYLMRILKKFNLNPRVFIVKYKGKPSVFVIRVTSKKLVEFIREYLSWKSTKGRTVHLKKEITSFSKLLGG